MGKNEHGIATNHVNFGVPKFKAQIVWLPRFQCIVAVLRTNKKQIISIFWLLHEIQTHPHLPVPGRGLNPLLQIAIMCFFFSAQSMGHAPDFCLVCVNWPHPMSGISCPMCLRQKPLKPFEHLLTRQVLSPETFMLLNQNDLPT